MKASAGFGQFLTAAVALSSTASAWPSWLPDIDSLIVRQNDASSTSAAQETGSATATANKPTTTNLNQATATSDSGSTTGGSGTTTGTGTGTSKGTGKGTATSGKGSATTHKTFDAQDPAGGVTMITPATTAGTQLYRIGETITWVWNYTSLQATPSAIDVLVSCSAATQSWTLTSNMSYEATGTYTWDTNAYSQTAVQNQLLTEEYTLIIYDAESSVSATAEAGYLGSSNPLTFGMYNSRPYKNLSEWQCVTCSSASGNLDRKALSFAVGMATITVLSFTWFVAGFGTLL